MTLCSYLKSCVALKMHELGAGKMTQLLRILVAPPKDQGFGSYHSGSSQPPGPPTLGCQYPLLDSRSTYTHVTRTLARVCVHSHTHVHTYTQEGMHTTNKTKS